MNRSLRLFPLALHYCLVALGILTCASLAHAEVTGDPTPKSFEKDGVYYENASYTERTCEVARNPNGYKGDIVIPATVTFNVTPLTVVGIQEDAFKNYRELTSVNIQAPLTSIPANFFLMCTGLKSVTIPPTVTSIEERAFSNCLALWEITIPNSVVSIGHEAFGNCRSLSSIEIPNSVTSIEGGLFSQCYNLEKVKIGKDVTKIGDRAFNECCMLREISLCSSMQSIGEEAFLGCEMLREIRCAAVEPPVCGRYAFSGVNYSVCKLYVPEESVDAYRNAPRWDGFPIINDFGPHAVIDEIDAVNNNCEESYRVYGLDGVLKLTTTDRGAVNRLPAGLYIVNGKKVMVK